MSESRALRIVACERLDQGIVLKFSSGEIALFLNEFLYETRDKQGNTELEEYPDKEQAEQE